MNERVRNALIIAVIGFGLIAVAVFFLTRVVSQSLAPQQAPAAPTPVSIRVVVSNRDIDIGSVLREGDTSIIDVPVEAAPRNSFETEEDVLGKVTKFKLVTGQMILDHQLADPTNINHDLAFILPDDKVLFAFQPSDLMTSLGIPQRGDIVDILVTISKEAPPADLEEDQLATEEELIVEEFTIDAFQLVEIGAVVFDVVTQEAQEDESGEPLPTPIPESTDITIFAYLRALDPQDALLLKHLQDTGAVFDLVLRSPTSTQLFELVPITEDYLVDRFQLERP